MTVKENLAVLESLSCESLSFDTLKNADQVLGQQFGNLPVRGEPMLDSCCCCCTPCCSCSAAVEDHPFN